MTDAPRPRGGFGRKLGVIAALGILGSGLGPLVQLLVPAVLLRVWTESEYALVVAIQGISVYVSIADAGILPTLLHRLSVMIAAGEHAEAKRVAAGGLRALVLLSAIGVVVVLAIAFTSGKLMSRHLATVTAHRPMMIVVALTAQVLGGASSVALGGFRTSV